MARRSRLACISIVLSGLACGDGDSNPVVTHSPENPPPPEAPTVAPEIVAWIQDNAIPLDTDDPTAPLDDLEPLRDLIGDARVVALGEATHGTREFFRFKHRLVRFLVEEMGFDLFAIEASMPESFRMDDFVQGGPGEDEVMLSGLHFWTWRTEAVLDMIRWMRAHNAAPGAAPRVRFSGFDVQFPGMAVHTLDGYLAAHDPDGAAFATEQYTCLDGFLNGPDGQFPGRYADLDRSVQNACEARVQAVLDYLLEHRAALLQVSPLQAYERAVQDARLVLQFEGLRAERAGLSRDASMAANALWLLEQAGPGARMALWAHNGHVNTLPGWQGDYLRQALGDDLVTIALSFGSGAFTAGTLLAGGGFGPIQRHEVGSPPTDSYEYRLGAALMPRLLLDLRNRNLASPGASWLTGPRPFRSVGSGFAPENPEWFFPSLSLPSAFDAVLYVDQTTESLLIPFRPPSTW